MTRIKHMDRFTLQGHNIAKLIVDKINESGGKARIDVTYLDFGQRWAWETILVYSKSLDLDYQALSPKEFKEMNEGIISDETINKIIEGALK
jgi:hypothetical protein